MKSNITGLTYAQSGVDIDAGNKLIDNIKPAASKTSRAGVISGLGGFGALFDLKDAGFIDPILVSATDGVGTKLRIAIELEILDTIGIDLVAMCVNDLICQGAEPLFFLDYFATGNLELEKATKVISGIAKGCSMSNCALIGGETAEMPGMYKGADFDLAGLAVGAFERGFHLPKPIKNGDLIIGLPSSGIHSNGFSLVRKIVEISGLNYKSQSPFSDNSLGLELLTPTEIYAKPCLKVIETGQILGLAHITGGGLTENIIRILEPGLGLEINLESWTLPAVFNWLASAGSVDPVEMLKTFNCGIGMVLIIPSASRDLVKQILGSFYDQVFEIVKPIIASWSATVLVSFAPSTASSCNLESNAEPESNTRMPVSR